MEILYKQTNQKLIFYNFNWILEELTKLYNYQNFNELKRLELKVNENYFDLLKKLEKIRK